MGSLNIPLWHYQIKASHSYEITLPITYSKHVTPVREVWYHACIQFVSFLYVKNIRMCFHYNSLLSGKIIIWHSLSFSISITHMSFSCPFSENQAFHTTQKTTENLYRSVYIEETKQERQQCVFFLENITKQVDSCLFYTQAFVRWQILNLFTNLYPGRNR